MSLNYLKDKYKYSLLELLQKYEEMYDGTLDKHTGSSYAIELKEDPYPYHTKPFLIPRIYEPTLKYEVYRLIFIGVLKFKNSQWADSTFIIPKKKHTVGFISDFRELNKQ